MPNNNPAATTLESIQAKIDSASQKCITNYGFFIGATPNNLVELQRAVGEPGEGIAYPGICGIKIFWVFSTHARNKLFSKHIRILLFLATNFPVIIVLSVMANRSVKSLNRVLTDECFSDI